MELYGIDSRPPISSLADAEGQWISYRAVTPVEVVPVGDLLQRHREANIDLRLVPSLAAIRETVLDSGLPFSVIRYKD